jgi:bifunctional DNA-binding transcriptional regulator/antitoxin component of YhaV-PrlF toxin-antitoxin module
MRFIMTVATITSKNQITIPKALMKRFEGQRYVSIIDTPDGLLFKPMDEAEERLEKLRAKVKSLGITPMEISNIVKRVRAEHADIKQPIARKSSLSKRAA